MLRKELLWIHNRTQLMIRYTLLEAPSDVRLRLRPFFAFRDKHALTHANMEADGRSRPIPGGVKCRLYSDFPWLYLQTDCRDAEFVPAPDWYYNFEYAREIERGYEGDEDLLTTGYFELSLGRRQSVIFSASVEAIPDPAAIGGMFAEALSARSRKVDFLSCLRHSARQFVVRRRDGRAEVLAGYPWYGQIGRQTLVAWSRDARRIAWMCSIRSCADAGTVCLRVLSRLPRLRMLRFGFSGCFSSCSGRWVRRRYGSATVS